MKPIKLAGLTVALVLLALAVLAAGTASATQLCADTTCETVYESGQALEAGLVESTSATLTYGFLTISCSTSTLKGKTTAKTGSPLTGEITGLTFEGCEMGETECTVTAINLPYKAAIAETGQGSGTLTVSSGGSGSPGAEANCGLKCTATATEVALSVEGGAVAIVKAKEAKLKSTGGLFCPETTTWTAEYQVTTPQPMLVGGAPTVLCEVAPDASGVCPKNKGYTSKKVYGDLAAGVGSFEDYNPATGKKITCEVVTFVGEYTENGKGEVGALNYESKTGGPCSSNWAKTAKTQANPPIAVTVGKKLPFTDSFFMYKPAGSAQGILSFGTQFNELALSVEKGAVACVYNPALYGKPAAAISNGIGANPTLASVGSTWTRISETPAAGACPVQLLASYTLAMTRLPAPAVLYIGEKT